MTEPTQKIQDALLKNERVYTDALARLRELASPEAENEVYDITFTLREAVEMVRCLRRLTEGRSVAEIHKAFGAPGDFGYHTPLGDALIRFYRGEP